MVFMTSLDDQIATPNHVFVKYEVFLEAYIVLDEKSGELLLDSWQTNIYGDFRLYNSKCLPPSRIFFDYIIRTVIFPIHGFACLEKMKKSTCHII